MRAVSRLTEAGVSSTGGSARATAWGPGAASLERLSYWELVALPEALAAACRREGAVRRAVMLVAAKRRTIPRLRALYSAAWIGAYDSAPRLPENGPVHRVARALRAAYAGSGAAGC